MPSKSKHTPPATEDKPLSRIQQLYNRYTAIKQDPRHRLVVSFVLLVIAGLLLYAYYSYITATATADYSLNMTPRANDIHTATYTNGVGASGSIIAHWLVSNLFGLAALCLPITLIIAAIRMLRAKPVPVWDFFIHCTLLSALLSIVFASLQGVGQLDAFSLNMPFYLGGNVGYTLTKHLHQFFGAWGALILILSTTFIYIIYVFPAVYNALAPLSGHRKIMPITKNDEDLLDEDSQEEEYEEESEDTEEELQDTHDTPSTAPTPIITQEPTPQPILAPTAEPTFTPSAPPSVQTIDDTGEVVMEVKVANGDDDILDADTASIRTHNAIDDTLYDPRQDLSLYRYPSVDLLYKHDNSPVRIDEQEQAENKQRITDTLRHFKVNIKAITATIGPTITLYEITLEEGVRISTVKNLEDDIAMSLQAKGVRIIAPMPGKGTIGIEVPNKHPQMVPMEGLIMSRKFQETDMHLPIALGRTTTNEVFMFDLAKAPHLLVAGATGQGKSVGLNAMITSLLFKKHPAELKLVMIDPKRVELSMYSPIENHFLAKLSSNSGNIIITEVQNAIDTLNSIVQEMENRYILLEQVNVRNVIEYNEKFCQRILNPNAGHRYLPYIVVVIDEYGDFIMTVGKEVEIPITRIAQKARAVGIHMIIATQRPDAKIVTGNIKANFPTRVAFRVSSAIDSRTIINDKGAEQLVGRGDLLYMGGDKPVRVQCAFLDTPEVEAVTKFISEQQSFGAPYELPEPESATPTNDAVHDERLNGKRDELFADCARYVVQNQRASASSLQAAYAIGYNRASRIMLHLEAAGIIGPDRGTKPREIFYQDLNELENLLNQSN